MSNIRIAKASDNDKISIEECIKLNSPQVVYIKSLSNSFVVEYIQKSSLECINPDFPSIKISLPSMPKEKVIAWIHLVHSDSKYKNFVDADFNIFPFYSFNNEFFDAPLWSFTSRQMPLSYWQGHAYALGVINNKIQLLGGIKWGFNLKPSSLKPETILPDGLTAKDLEDDMLIINEAIKNIIGSL